MSLLFNMLSRFVIAFLLRSEHLLISWLQSPSAVIFQPKKIKSLLFPLFSRLFVMKWWEQMLWSLFFECKVLRQLFHSFLSLSSRVSWVSWVSSKSFSLLSAIRVVSCTYLSLLIFLLAVLIPACASSSPPFFMNYSSHKVNKQGDNIYPWRTPFPIWNQSVVPCPVLTVAPWPANRFLRRHVRWSSIYISWRIFHSLLWSTKSKALA